MPALNDLKNKQKKTKNKITAQNSKNPTVYETPIMLVDTFTITTVLYTTQNPLSNTNRH